ELEPRAGDPLRREQTHQVQMVARGPIGRGARPVPDLIHPARPEVDDAISAGDRERDRPRLGAPKLAMRQEVGTLELALGLEAAQGVDAVQARYLVHAMVHEQG